MNRAVKILLVILSVFIVFFVGLTVYWFAVTAGEKLDPAKLALAENCVAVFDREGKEIPAARTGAVSVAELPDYLPNAFVAVEDKRFYDHGGLDFKRMAKAAWKNFITFSFREGASTISQQLVKNTHLTGEKTIKRKLKEIKLTRELEKNYTKSEILELYLNSIYFGHSAFGVESAARFYFGKPARDLTPAESAMLAALVKSPNRYSPFRDGEKCLARRNFVLSLMEQQGYLTAEERIDAQKEPLPAAPCESDESPYLSLVFEELAALFPDAASGEKLRVYTALDPDLQEVLRSVETDSDVCLYVRDAVNGGVKGFYSTCGAPKRLPASTIKPLAVYAPALEENLVAPATPVLDEKTDFGGYSPSDYGGKYGGYMSVRYALSHSVNVPAVKTLNALGVAKAAQYLERLDLPVPEEDRTLALALGGMKEGYSLPALTDGYATFARGGAFLPSHCIERVEDSRGKLLYGEKECREKAAERRVFSEDTAYLMNDMLMTAAHEGTAKRLKGLSFEVAAKTGTGGTESGNTDAYTIAYTSEDAVGVWLGNRDNSPVEAVGGGLPADLALKILRTLYAEREPLPFARSEKVLSVLLDREEYEQNHRVLLADPLAPEYLSLKELFRETALPEGTSEKFSRPRIREPQISVVNGSVKIILCQTEYYDYEVKRRCDGESCTIYKGKYRSELFDNSVCGGKDYIYSVTPYYCGIAGETVTLPSVHIEKSGAIPDDWWEE